MKTIQYKKEKYNVPESWDEVPIKKLIELNLDSQEFKTESTKKLAFISAFVGIPVDVIKKSKVTEIQKLFKHLEFMTDPLPEDPIFEFEFRGEKYSVKQTFNEMEFQDYVSMETVMSDNNGELYKALPMLLAILCKKEGESMDDYDVGERAKLFEELPVTIANPLSVFFYAQEKLSNMITLAYSNRDLVIQMKRREVLDTLKKQGGTGLLTRLLTGILRFWIKYIIPERTLSSTSTPQNSHTPKWRRMFRRL